MKRRPPDAAQALSGPAEFDIAAILRRAAPVCLVIGAWMAFHPYTGIVHDARLYAAIALRELYPNVFADDLFFAFGSQGDFTLFTPLFASLVDLLGLHPASLLTVALGQLLWLSGASALAVRLAPNSISAIVGIVLLIVGPAIYGVDYFRFGEGIATPRLFAEGLTFWALYALIDFQLTTALILATMATLVHPLMGIAAFGVGWSFLLVHDRRWIFLGIAGLAGVAAAAIAGVAPFDKLGQTIDSEWLNILQARVYYLFPSLWSSRDWSRIVAMLAMALSGSLVFPGLVRHVTMSTVLAALFAIIVTFVGADILKNAFLLEVQLYRVLWFLSAVAYINAGFLFTRLWLLKDDGLSIIALAVVTWLLVLLIYPEIGALCSVVVLALAVLRLRGAIGPLHLVVRVFFMSFAIMVIGLLVVFRTKWALGLFATSLDPTTIWRSAGLVSIIEVSVAAILLLAVFRHPAGRVQRILPVAAVLFAVAATVGWDRRDDWTRMLTEEHPIGAFDAILPLNATVYWDQDVRGAWLLLQRPSYISMAQGGGLVFNRETALEYRDRAIAVAPLANRSFVELYDTDREAPSLVRTITLDQIVSTCRGAKGLDAIVLAVPVGSAYAARWRLPKPIYDVAAMAEDTEQQPVRSFYLYRCEDLL